MYPAASAPARSLPNMYQPHRHASRCYKLIVSASSPCSWSCLYVHPLAQLFWAQILAQRGLSLYPINPISLHWALSHMEMLWLEVRWFLHVFTTGMPTRRAGSQVHSCILFMFCPHAQAQSWYLVNIKLRKLDKIEKMHPKHMLINT